MGQILTENVLMSAGLMVTTDAIVREKYDRRNFNNTF